VTKDFINIIKNNMEIIKMYSIGRICVKTAGRDAGKYCVIIEQIDNDYVMIDGETRRRKCNIDHLEPTDKTVELKKGADNKAVVSALNDAGIHAVEKKEDKVKKEKTNRPKKENLKKEKAVKSAKKDKEKKEAKKDKKLKTAEKK
jgi:large subunit ribosomal protein L14e